MDAPLASALDAASAALAHAMGEAQRVMENAQLAMASAKEAEAEMIRARSQLQGEREELETEKKLLGEERCVFLVGCALGTLFARIRCPHPFRGREIANDWAQELRSHASTLMDNSRFTGRNGSARRRSSPIRTRARPTPSTSTLEASEMSPRHARPSPMATSCSRP